MKAIAYLRVSTENQVGEDKYGLDAQKVDIVNYAAKNGIHIVDWFIEEGVSGGKLDRPELNRLLASETGVPSVIIAKTDRLSRDIQMYYFLKLSLKKKGLDLISVQEDWGSYGVMAPMLEAMVVAFAEFERQMITSRTSNGRSIKASKGGYSGGTVPYGYKVLDGKLLIDDKEAEVVKGIFELSDSGKSLRNIATHLNDLCITTRNKKQFYASSLGYIIRNRKFYEGLYKYGDMEEYVEGTHTAII